MGVPRVCELGLEPQMTPSKKEIGTTRVAILSFFAFPAPSCAEFWHGFRPPGGVPPLQSQLIFRVFGPSIQFGARGGIFWESFSSKCLGPGP